MVHRSVRSDPLLPKSQYPTLTQKNGVLAREEAEGQP